MHRPSQVAAEAARDRRRWRVLDDRATLWRGSEPERPRPTPAAAPDARIGVRRRGAGRRWPRAAQDRRGAGARRRTIAGRPSRAPSARSCRRPRSGESMPPSGAPRCDGSGDAGDWGIQCRRQHRYGRARMSHTSGRSYHRRCDGTSARDPQRGHRPVASTLRLWTRVGSSAWGEQCGRTGGGGDFVSCAPIRHPGPGEGRFQ